MKAVTKLFLLMLAGIFMLVSCGPKPQYKTRLGKKKLKYYNSIQYDKGKSPKNIKSFKDR